MFYWCFLFLVVVFKRLWCGSKNNSRRLKAVWKKNTSFFPSEWSWANWWRHHDGGFFNVPTSSLEIHDRQTVDGGIKSGKFTNVNINDVYLIFKSLMNNEYELIINKLFHFSNDIFFAVLALAVFYALSSLTCIFLLCFI